MRKPSSKMPPTARRWRVSIIRSKSTYLGTVEAPNQNAAEVTAAELFGLSDHQRKRLVLREVA
jgi:hypothetical protein